MRVAMVVEGDGSGITSRFIKCPYVTSMSAAYALMHRNARDLTELRAARRPRCTVRSASTFCNYNRVGLESVTSGEGVII